MASELHPHQVEHLKNRREHLVNKIARVKALPKHREHDHPAAIQRAENHIAEIDRELAKDKPPVAPEKGAK